MLDPVRLELFTSMDGIDSASRVANTSGPKVLNEGTAPPFMDVLKASVMKVNEVQKESDNLIQRLALGEVDDISEVSIAVEKAELALRLMLQIRDKLVDAYQQIARMSV